MEIDSVLVYRYFRAVTAAVTRTTQSIKRYFSFVFPKACLTRILLRVLFQRRKIRGIERSERGEDAFGARFTTATQ